MEKNKKNSKQGLFWLIFFLSLFTFGILSTIGYVTYKTVESLKPRNQFLQIDNVDKDNFINEPEEIKIEEEKTIDGESVALIFNSKENKENNKNNFKPGNLTIYEKPYINLYGKKEYFLGPWGLKLLNAMFKERVIYGPEINDLSVVKINEDLNIRLAKLANGLYFPDKKEIYISLAQIIAGNNESVMHIKPPHQLSNKEKWYENLKKSIIAKRVEMIFGTLMHEYTHHLDTVYNKTLFSNDPLADISLIEHSDAHNHSGKNFSRTINNKKFLDEFRTNLNFHDLRNENKNKYLRSKDDFIHRRDQIPVFKEFSSNDLFRFANVENLSSKERSDFKKLDNGRYYFNNGDFGLAFAEPITTSQIKYLFSFTELVPRELLKLSLGPNFWFYKKFPDTDDSFKNFFYFEKNGGDRGDRIVFNAVGVDILKNIGIIRRGFGNTEMALFAPNWVFKDQIEKFVSNETIRTKNGFLVRNEPFANIGDKFHKGLFKSYIDLLGFGELISYANRPNSASNSFNFGGYFQIPKNLFVPIGSSIRKLSKNDLIYSLDNIKPKLLLVNKDDPSKYLEVNIGIQKYNFLAKKEWNSQYKFQDDKFNKVNYYDETWIYPKNDSYEYVSYYTENIDKNKLKSIIKSNKFDIRLWIDKNQDGKHEFNKGFRDSNKKETFSLLNDNVWNNKGSHFLKRSNENKRKTTTYRNIGSNFKRSGTYEWFKLSLDATANKDKYYYSIEDYSANKH